MRGKHSSQSTTAAIKQPSKLFLKRKEAWQRWVFLSDFRSTLHAHPSQHGYASISVPVTLSIMLFFFQLRPFLSRWQGASSPQTP
jgi:hypothetical protein